MKLAQCMFLFFLATTARGIAQEGRNVDRAKADLSLYVNMCNMYVPVKFEYDYHIFGIQVDIYRSGSTEPESLYHRPHFPSNPLEFVAPDKMDSAKSIKQAYSEVLAKRKKAKHQLVLSDISYHPGMDGVSVEVKAMVARGNQKLKFTLVFNYGNAKKTVITRDTLIEPGAATVPVVASGGSAGTDPGILVAGAPQVCVHCGKPLPERARFCPYCGKPQPTTASPPAALLKGGEPALGITRPDLYDPIPGTIEVQIDPQTMTDSALVIGLSADGVKAYLAGDLAKAEDLLGRAAQSVDRLGRNMNSCFGGSVVSAFGVVLLARGKAAEAEKTLARGVPMLQRGQVYGENQKRRQSDVRLAQAALKKAATGAFLTGEDDVGAKLDAALAELDAVSASAPAPNQTIRPAASGKGPIPGKNWTVPDLGMEFLWIKKMNMWVGKYEVTNAEYRVFKPKHKTRPVMLFAKEPTKFVHRRNVPNYNVPETKVETFWNHQQCCLDGDRQPAVGISFEDARIYADELTRREGKADRLPVGFGYRLPQDREWTVLAQCGDGRVYPWGDSFPPKYGNYRGEEHKGLRVSGMRGYRDGAIATCPVEQSGRNDWGLFGVGGNVWEHTTKDYSPTECHLLRGGSWETGDDPFSGGVNPHLRVDIGMAVSEFCLSTSGNGIGFRLVLAWSGN